MVIDKSMRETSRLRMVTELFVEGLDVGEDALPVGTVTHHDHVVDFEKREDAVVSGKYSSESCAV